LNLWNATTAANGAPEEERPKGGMKPACAEDETSSETAESEHPEHERGVLAEEGRCHGPILIRGLRGERHFSASGPRASLNGEMLQRKT
jgi:hypothetical protein